LAGLLSASFLVAAHARAVSSLGQSTPAERDLWARLRPSIALITEGQAVVGSAVCIDKSGLFLAHHNSVRRPNLVGRLDDGLGINFQIVSTDSTTDLVLLKVSVEAKSSGSFFDNLAVEPPRALEGTGNWVPVEVAKEATANRLLLAALPTGPVRAEVAQADIVAADRQTRQIVAVNQIRFDAPAQMLAGALLFDAEGKLVGLLGAVSSQSQTLALRNSARDFTANQNPALSPSVVQDAVKAGQGGLVSGPLLNQKSSQFTTFGPSGLQEAFALAPVVLSRVVAGFKAADHIVRHPALGATCSDALNGEGISVGAEVKTVANASPAAKAGLQPGDIIVLIDGAIVNNPIDYAWALLNKEVGQAVRVTIRRGESVLELKATVGSAIVTAQAAQKKPSTAPLGAPGTH
jgi:S1-C subfamily serine protease